MLGFVDRIGYDVVILTEIGQEVLTSCDSELLAQAFKAQYVKEHQKNINNLYKIEVRRTLRYSV